MKSQLPIFSFVAYDFWWHVQEAIAKSNVMNLWPRFSSTSFIVLAFTFRFLIHFGLNFVHDVRWGSNFLLLQVNIQFSQHQLLNAVSSFHEDYNCLVYMRSQPGHSFIHISALTRPHKLSWCPQWNLYPVPLKCFKQESYMVLFTYLGSFWI